MFCSGPSYPSITPVIALLLENFLKVFRSTRIRMILFSIIKCWRRSSGSAVPSARSPVRRSTCRKLHQLTFDEAFGTAWAVSKSRLISSSHAGEMPVLFSKDYPGPYTSANQSNPSLGALRCDRYRSSKSPALPLVLLHESGADTGYHELPPSETALALDSGNEKLPPPFRAASRRTSR